MWCDLHKQPFVSVDRGQQGKPNVTGVTVMITLFTTRAENGQSDHFTPTILREAVALAQARLGTADGARRNPLSVSPTCIRVSHVVPDHAEDLALGLVALYRQMQAPLA